MTHEWKEEVDPDLLREFLCFDESNPEVYQLFRRFSQEALTAGRTRFSCWMIANRIRWYTQVETRDDSFKLNNNFIGLYARKLADEHPQFKKLFTFRKMKKERNPRGNTRYDF